MKILRLHLNVHLSGARHTEFLLALRILQSSLLSALPNSFKTFGKSQTAGKHLVRKGVFIA